MDEVLSLRRLEGRAQAVRAVDREGARAARDSRLLRRTGSHEDAYQRGHVEEDTSRDTDPAGRWASRSRSRARSRWLASDQADYVVGTTLFVDGGMTLYPGLD